MMRNGSSKSEPVTVRLANGSSSSLRLSPPKSPSLSSSSLYAFLSASESSSSAPCDSSEASSYGRVSFTFPPISRGHFRLRYLTFAAWSVVKRGQYGRLHVRVLYQAPGRLDDVRNPRAAIDDVHLELPQAEQRERAVCGQLVRINGKIVFARQRPDGTVEVGKVVIDQLVRYAMQRSAQQKPHLVPVLLLAVKHPVQVVIAASGGKRNERDRIPLGKDARRLDQLWWCDIKQDSDFPEKIVRPGRTEHTLQPRPVQRATRFQLLTDAHLLARSQTTVVEQQHHHHHRADAHRFWHLARLGNTDKGCFPYDHCTQRRTRSDRSLARSATESDLQAVATSLLDGERTHHVSHVAGAGLAYQQTEHHLPLPPPPDLWVGSFLALAFITRLRSLAFHPHHPGGCIGFL
uniref:Uncharacterized protein n=1 Tax=Anopheles farauti TaxID=69004 RepID=A0A182QB27_9DIPT